MKILLVNPNRYHHPPVIPLGLEYLAGALKKSKHKYEVLDLCFSDDPVKDLKERINSYDPSIVGITFRQIDTVLFHTNEYYVDDLKKLVSACRQYGKKIILGGAGFSIAPSELLSHTEADFGICGPGERALITLLDKLESNSKPEPVIDCYGVSESKDFHFKRERVINYNTYLIKEGAIGFRTQVGCNENCIYCPEGDKKITPMDPKRVAMEIKELTDAGYNNFHLCDSEFNLNLDYSISICRALSKNIKNLKWSLYMKPFPFSEELFQCLQKSGASMITLSLDTVPQKYSEHDYEKLEQFFALSRKHGIKIAVDLMTGFPYEKREDAINFISFLKDQPAETVGVNNNFRVYPNTPLCSIIKKDRSLHKYLINYNENSDFIKPVFFRYFSDEDISSIIRNYSNFRLEGPEKATNYQRVK
ncbi:B12-binding domain-containing radical SAM protein [Spirochaetota bacterium]